MTVPLAERMRPRTLDEYVGQEHLVGPGGALRRALASGHVPSFILWGPPGTGKTTLARIVAQTLERPFFSLSAIHAGVKDVRETLDKARKQRFFDRPAPILFIDEIHRFSKAQQDSLLSAVERGLVTLIGATTENPSFELIPALLSRCQVYVLEPLSREQLLALVDRALKCDEVLRKLPVEIRAHEALLRFSGGDARKLYNALELVCMQAEPGGKPLVVTDELVTRLVQEQPPLYDKGGEYHYDLASAFIKSIRGSDPNAAVYWLARMIEGGEDVRFIARRLVISAAEDVGLANPNALLLATAAAQAVQWVGLPEARIILSEAAIYLAASPKSNSAYLAIDAARQAVRTHGSAPVPLHLRNASTRLMRQLDYGKDYRYSHDYEGHFVEQEYLPRGLEGTSFYRPADNARERRLADYLRQLWKDKYEF